MATRLIEDTRLGSLIDGRHILFRAANIEDSNEMLREAISVIQDQMKDVTVVAIEPSANGTIGIDSLREYLSAVNMKSATGERLIISISSAVAMTPEAQNSLLKSLEDSTEGKQYLLAGDYTNKLLPTVISRTDIVDYTPVDDNTDESLKALFKASGYSHSAVADYDNNPERLKVAKQWVGSDILKRISITKDMKSAKEATDFINDLLVVYNALLQSSYDKGESTKAIVAKIDKLNTTVKRLERVGNVRLNLAQLALEI